MNSMSAGAVKNLYLNLGIKNEDEFKIYLENYDLDIQKIYEKMNIENSLEPINIYKIQKSGNHQ